MIDFSFLPPLPFRLFYTLPLLLVPYLLRERGRRTVVPALFLYQGLPSSARRRLWGRLQLRPLFLLQLLILLLLVVAAAQPFIQRQGGKVALVLDTSASMQARAPSGERSLFDAAKRQAAKALATIPGVDTISLFTSAPLPAPASAPSDDRAHIQHDLARVEASDAPDPSDEVLSAFFAQLLGERGFQQVFFFTDRARLFIEDGLAVDNEAYAVLPALTNVPVLLVTPSPDVAKSLRQIPNLKLERIPPQDYDPAKAARFPLVLFHLTAPDTLPPTNAAFILPPEGNALFPLGKATSQLQVTQWATAHPLTAYVTFSLLSPPYAQAFLPVSWCKPVISATVGPLVLAGERDGRRYAAVGFDLLPYLGKKNLPASILTLNLLGWLEGQAGQPPSLKTGASLALQGEAARVRLPTGNTLLPVGSEV